MVSNLFRELGMQHVKGYDKLSDWHKNLFDRMYKKHIASLQGHVARLYSEQNIVEIKSGLGYVKVYFRHGKCSTYSMKNQKGFS